MVEVASIQLEIKDDQTPANRLDQVEVLLDSLEGADLVLLPEIWRTGYFNFSRYHEEAETLAGETIARLAAKARQKQFLLLAGSLVERQGEDYYNTSVMIDRRGNVEATYRKIHLFGYGSSEQRLLKRGTQPTVVQTDLGRFGLATCYDLRFPELFRRMVDQGAQAFLIVSAWPYPRLPHWQALNQVRAFENQCFLVSCNCAGLNQGTRLCGHSMVVDPWGVVIAGAGDREAVVRARIDLSLVDHFRAEFPALKDRVL